MMKENLVNFIWFLAIYALLVLINTFIPQNLRFWGMILGMASIFGLLKMQELMVRDIVSKYAHLHAIVRGFGRTYKLHLYVSDYRQVKVGKDLYRTEVKLGIPVTTKAFGKVDKLYIFNKRPIEERLRLESGGAYYAGTWITHPKTDTVILWEISEPVIRHGEIIPQYWLREGGADRDMYMGEYIPHRKLVKEEVITE